MVFILNILHTPIPDLMVVETNPHADYRGTFTRLYCNRELKIFMGSRQFVQVNLSRTNMVGAIRGMHFQHVPHAEMKLVRCIKGRVWDVAVDLRAHSPTFLKWHALELSQNNAKMIIIPEGFAHGFQVLEPDSELLYFHTEFYEPSSEGGLRFDDPKLNISWPLPIVDVSARDLNHLAIDLNFQGLQV